MGKKATKSGKDNSYKLERTRVNKERRAARLKRRAKSPEHKTAKNRARKARQLAAAKERGCADYRALQKRRAWLNSFDSSVEVLGQKKPQQTAEKVA